MKKIPMVAVTVKKNSKNTSHNNNNNDDNNFKRTTINIPATMVSEYN